MKVATITRRRFADRREQREQRRRKKHRSTKAWRAGFNACRGTGLEAPKARRFPKRIEAQYLAGFRVCYRILFHLGFVQNPDILTIWRKSKNENPSILPCP